MRALSKRLIRKFDLDSDGIISFKELSNGLKSLNIFLTGDERDALMNKLDTNKDGDISEKELYKALSSVNPSDLQ